MILYFSGTGNSEYVANRIASELQEECFNLFDRIRNNNFSGLSSERPWIIVCPTYAWRIPRILQNYLEKTSLSGNQNVYFVMTCGGSIGNAGKYLKQFCASKKMNYCGCFPILMPENYIAMFPTPKTEEALSIIEAAESKIDHAAALIKDSTAFPEPSLSIADKLSSGFVNEIFYPLFVHAKKFHVTDSCISCGKCMAVCPLGNIRFPDGKPVWGKNCTHCMACISRCPKECIEYGKKSQNMPRYTFPK